MGGAELVAPIRFDPDIRLLIDSGFAMAGSVKRKIMKRSACHENIARLWKTKYRGLVGVGTGTPSVKTAFGVSTRGVSDVMDFSKLRNSV